VAITPVIWFGEHNGIITVAAGGGTAPYAYTFDANPWQPSNILTGVNQGPHVVKLKDANGCSKDSTVIMTEPAPLEFDSLQIVRPTCEGFADGAVTLFGTGGIAPYTYSNDGANFSTQNLFDNLSEGIYTFFVKDGNGCVHDTVLDLKGYPHIIVDQPDVTDVLCHGDRTGKIVVNASGGNPPLSYRINGRGPYRYTNVFDSLKAGTYQIIIKDSTHCT